MTRILFGFITFFMLFDLTGQQNNLVVFTQESTPFYVVLNGIRQNKLPQTNVKVENVKGEFQKVRVIFENEKLEPLDQSVSFFKEGVEAKIEVIYKNDTYRLRYGGESAIRKSEPPSGQKVISFRESNASSKSGKDVTSDKRSGQATISSKKAQKEALIEQTAEEAVDGIEPNKDYVFLQNGSMCEKPSVNQEEFLAFKYALDAENMFNQEAFILDFFKENCMTSAQIAGIVKMEYTTVKPYKIARNGYRYTWDTENYGLVVAALENEGDRKMIVNFLDAGQVGTDIDKPDQGQAKVLHNQNGSPIEKESLIPDYSGGVGCPNHEFVNVLELKEKVDKESTGADKMELIRTATQNKCLDVAQVRTLASAFTMEDIRLDFVQWAYHHTYDVDDYYLIFKEFIRGSNKEKLSDFILEQPENVYGIIKSKDAEILPVDYVGKIGSKDPILNTEKVTSALSDHVFKKDKILILNHVLKHHALTVEQFKELANASFTSENDILEFAEMAYPKIYDLDNFHNVKDIFTFNSSKKELDELIEKQKK